MKRIFVTAAFAALAFASAASAEEANGWYGSASAGVAVMNDPDFTVSDSGDTLATRLKTDNGFGVNGQVGYRFGQVSVGVDVSYQQHGISGIDFRSVNGTALTHGDIAGVISDLEAGGVIDPSTAASFTVDGTTVSVNDGDIAKLRQVGVMAVARYDIPTGTVLEPYVAGGIGVAATHLEAFDEGSTRTAFAWQLGAGLSVNVAQNVKLSADYRYRQVGGGDLDSDFADLRLGRTSSHFFGAGVRVGF